MRALFLPTTRLILLSTLIALSPARSSFAQAPATSTTKPGMIRGGPVTPPQKRDVPGIRVKLAVGELYLPDFFKPSPQPTPLVIWAHGAEWLTEQNFYDARKNAALLTLNGSTIGHGFSDPATFKALLDEVNAALAQQIPGCPQVGKVCLASFSAGFTVVGDVLRHDRFKWLITDVILADSLYVMRQKGPVDREIDPEAIEPYMAFARTAATGKSTFIFSHLYPPEEKYRNNPTTVAAVYMMQELHLKKEPGLKKKNSAGAELLYHADVKGFHILGYAGMLNQDHFNHLYGCADLLRMTSFPDAAPPPATQQDADETTTSAPAAK
jgi:hypothetical protein